jgi:hypothetical protein
MYLTQTLALALAFDSDTSKLQTRAKETYRHKQKRPTDTSKRDLQTQAKETYRHEQKRPTDTSKRDLQTQAKETYRHEQKRPTDTSKRDLQTRAKETSLSAGACIRLRLTTSASTTSLLVLQLLHY